MLSETMRLHGGGDPKREGNDMEQMTREANGRVFGCRLCHCARDISLLSSGDEHHRATKAVRSG